jgi:hypothetical protein
MAVGRNGSQFGGGGVCHASPLLDSWKELKLKEKETHQILIPTIESAFEKKILFYLEYQ